MRSTITTFFFCLSICCCLAQDDDKDKGWSLPNGFRAGYQWSNLENDTETAANNLDRFYVGYLRKFKLLHLLKVETGLEYMIAGAQQSDDTRLQLHYLVLPAQGVLKIGPFVGQAGLNANFRIAENLKVNGQSVDRDDKSANFDLAANVGAGFNFLMVTLEARYYWGLLEVDNGWYNRYSQFGLKFHF